MACAASPSSTPAAAAARRTLRVKLAALQPRPQTTANEMLAFAFRGRGSRWPMGERDGGTSQRAKGRPDAGTPRVVSREARAQTGTGWWFRSPGPRRALARLDACARPPEKAVRGGVTSDCRGLSFGHVPWSVGDALVRQLGTSS